MSGLVPRARLCAACLRHLRIDSMPAASRALCQVAKRGEPSQPPRSSRTLSARSIRSFSTSQCARAKKTIVDTSDTKQIKMSDFPPERIRNLSIIAHIDHGKSTLADRLLQMTGTVPASANAQFLDKLKVERERGITVKAQTVSIIHTHTDGQKYLINLIDTPGHVDFSYEVSRSIGACEGGLILVDCTQGIQAQTLSVFYVALEADLKLLAVVNKVDLPHASPEDTSEQIEGTLGLDSSEHMYISAKSGLGVEEVLKQIVEGLPPPKKWKDNDGKLRASVFDTHYDHYRGVVALVRLYSGQVKVGDKIRFLQADRKYEVLEIGIMNPEETPVDELKEGQVGYLICSMKNSEEAHIGDTICLDRELVEPLPGFKPMKAMVYAGVFPIDTAEFSRLEEAIERLTLNDRSVTVAKETSAALSQGFRLGFLGTLHMDVFRQRLEDEYSSNVIITAPTVPYRITYTNGTVGYISNPTEFPDSESRTRTKKIEEPMVTATIIVPNEYIGQMMDLCSSYRGNQLEYKVLETSGRSMLKYSFPLSEIVTDFFSALKSASSGFATFDYEEAGYESSDMVKMNILLNGKPVDALAMIVHRSAAQKIGKEWVKKLKEVVPRQLFELAIQAAIGGKVLARESLPAMRKDVTAGLYGGHFERKLKQLNKQKEGKKRLKMLAGNIEVPQSAFFDVLSSRPRNFSTSTRTQASTAMLPSDHYEPPLPIVDTGKKNAYIYRQMNKKKFTTLQEDPLKAVIADSSMRALPPMEGEKRDHRPFRASDVSPEDRGKYVSELIRLDSKMPNSERFSNVYTAYVRAYYSSASGDVLTESEIRNTVLQLFKIQQNRHRGLNRREAEEKVRELATHLSLVTGKEADQSFQENILAMMEVRGLPSASDSDLEAMDKRISQIGRPDLEARRRDIEFALHLFAVAPKDNGRFDKHWRRLVVEDGMELSGRLYIARLKFLARRSERTEMVKLIKDAAATQQPASLVSVLNTAMTIFADRGEWSMVAEIYTTLTQTPAPFPLNDRSDILQIPDTVIANIRTFTDLIPLLSFSGYLEAALALLLQMPKFGFRPSVREYMAIIDGFASFGVTDPTRPREAISADVFPAWITVPVGRTRITHRVSFMERANFTRIWESGYQGAGPGGDGASSSSATDSAWNIHTLQALFQSCMEIRPGTRGIVSSRIAPGPDMAWFTLAAFARVTGGDVDVLRKVWLEMDNKFSGGTGEAWHEWRMNPRLERVVRVLTAEASE